MNIRGDLAHLVSSAGAGDRKITSRSGLDSLINKSVCVIQLRILVMLDECVPWQGVDDVCHT